MVLASRNSNRNEEAISDIKKEVKNSKGSLRSMILDLNSLQGVRDFVEEYENLNLPLHCLVCNAGLLFPSHFINQVQTLLKKQLYYERDNGSSS